MRRIYVSAIFALDRAYDDDFEELDEKAKVGVIRYKRTFKNDSYLGAVGTWRSFEADYNAVYGIDAQYRFLESNLISVNWLSSSTFRELDGGNNDPINANTWAFNLTHQTRKRSIGVICFKWTMVFNPVSDKFKNGYNPFGLNFSLNFS